MILVIHYLFIYLFIWQYLHLVIWQIEVYALTAIILFKKMIYCSENWAYTQ